MLANPFDQFVGRSLLIYGEFSQLEVDFLAHFIRPGDVVLDIGANIGALTIPFARMVGPKGSVIAFEPQRICFQALCANIALGSFANVVAMQWAVGAEDGATRVPLADPTKPSNFGGLAVSPTEGGETVILATLDGMSLPKPALIKVDVEGMEPEVLKGARQYITEHRPTLYLESDRADRRAELKALLDEMGYLAYAHNPPLYNPDNYRGDPQNVWPNVLSFNWLCLPREAVQPEGLEKVA